MFNCGMLAIELPAETIAEIFDLFGSGETTLETDLEKHTLTLDNGKIVRNYKFSIDPFDAELVKAGGWVAYADSRY
jgi:3-isopropylmalate/(R)-2-methylmalate dehydratase small subunit